MKFLGKLVGVILMYNVKVYMGNYDKSEFYSIMGKFFAERIYKRVMPYLINDKEKIWYLFFLDDELAGFCGVSICDEYTNFTDIYAVDKYQKTGILDFMCNRLFKLYCMENIRVLTDNSKEMEIWMDLGFKNIGEKGRYHNLLWVKNNE